MDAHSLYRLLPTISELSPIDALKMAGILEIGIVAAFAIWYTCLCWMRRIETED